MTGLAFFLTAAAIAPGATPAASIPSSPVPRYRVERASTAPIVDGKLDEAAWRTAATIELVFPWATQTGAKQKTLARLLWDDRALYLSFDCDDTDITAVHEKHDDPTYEDDAVELFINPDPKQSFYYGLEMNARGVLYDYFFAFPRPLIPRVDFQDAQPVASQRGSLNQPGDRDRGWSLEIAIPWSNFAELAGKALPPPAGAIWTANLNRWDGTKPNRRLSQWSPSGKDTPNPHNPTRFGELEFAPARASAPAARP